MSRRYLMFGVAVGSVLVILLLVVLFVRQPAPASASDAAAPDQRPLDQQLTVGNYAWNYSVKFVCGFQGAPQLPGETTVKPGNYATEINIHNYNYREFLFKKKFLLLALDGQSPGLEPRSVGPISVTNMILLPDFATMDDCNNLWTALNPGSPVPPTPMPLMIGYLVVISPLDLDIDAVYTASAPGDITAANGQTGISIDVVRVTGKRVFVPTGALP